MLAAPCTPHPHRSRSAPVTGMHASSVTLLAPVVPRGPANRSLRRLQVLPGVSTKCVQAALLVHAVAHAAAVLLGEALSWLPCRSKFALHT